MMKILMIFSYFTDGFAYAGEAMTGRYIGACDAVNLRKTVKWTFVWSMGLALLFIAIYHFGGVLLLRMMTSDATVVEASRGFLPWLLLMPVVGCAAFTWDGIFIGATGSREMRNSMLWSVVAFAGVWFVGIFLLATFAPSASADMSSPTSGVLPDDFFANLPSPVSDASAGISEVPGATPYGIIAMHILMAAYFAHLLARTIYLTLKSRSVLRILK